MIFCKIVAMFSKVNNPTNSFPPLSLKSKTTEAKSFLIYLTLVLFVQQTLATVLGFLSVERERERERARTLV